MKDKDINHFYEEIYGISRLSPRYWWRRRAKHRVLFGMLFLLIVASPIALLLWGPSLKSALGERYHAYRTERFLASAKTFLDAGDAASARIELQNALRHDPSNTDALLTFAKTVRQLDGSGHALWSFQAHLLRPDDPAIATLALGYAIEENQTEIGDFIMRSSLQRFPTNANLKILACHQLTRNGNAAAALRVAQQAKDLAPKSAEAAFLVASLSASSRDPKTRDAALADLRSFRENPKFHARASWALVNCLAPTAPDAALAILDELAQGEKTAWQARLRRIAITHRTSPGATPAALSALWTDARDPGQRRGVIESAEALAPTLAQSFLDNLDDAERDSLPNLISQFRLWANTKEWRRIADSAAAASQTDNATRLVTITLWQAKANSELNEANAARTCIRSALAKCEGDTALTLRAAMQLERLGMIERATEFYTQLAEKAPGRIGAFAWSRMAASARAGGRSADMLKTWEDALIKNPRDPQLMNNVASCLLLLGRDTPRALKLSAQAHAARPGNAFFGDTHALALATAGRTPEALAIHEKMPPQRLRLPQFALNYATVLDLAGRNGEAIALASNLNQRALLPEQIAVQQRILGIDNAERESLLLSPSKTPPEPAIPTTPSKPLGPMPDAPTMPDTPPLEFLPLPPADTAPGND